ncbi:MAG: preprotein translocase subunit SecA [Elusimicrobia bacterium RIFOXYB12_FULL_50_12]|nr:MAG: preprotein translocase subunit SecA [Elusimicrobia bacterium RIFOXYA12_FULL_49_49]OGS09738.1 MAG: preprotein translocase subunit SecA [Elusimicrobia bacterium RIFOXYB1_FULL_48_9]OGS15893.1 MAG: preprotein translocase subunit SecA [Elusimicrobia bacterium RIFOXYA2_FULL_47_53]OGS26425.1 MAG: preprotein translocase subunit SecA [Elusimicrobia bacterium RIFOXYB12_FULL_50_12]OGS29061.1 MAG: preprotein translocase subunit SecA [Elusimicrobia bacterium RIFOXYB2_FULL_46_23]
MIKHLLNSIFGSQNERTIKKLSERLAEINAFEPEISALSDDQLRAKTQEFKERIANGEPTDTLLPEAFACVREAAKRTIKLRHFDVQMFGGMVLHSGKIAEMKTGEGKTLVATLAVYLNALEGKGVHVVTVNDYLAKRDRNWMGPVYEFMGLTVGYVSHDMSNTERREAYACDVTYVTNNEIGFDYLRDNMVISKEDRVLRPLHYAIVDEVDSILIDEARTPLIISGPAEESTDKYYICNKLVPHLKGRKITETEEIEAKYKGLDLSAGYDYIVDEKNHSIVLTEQGVTKSEKILGVKNIYDDLQSEWVHHITQALRAHNLYSKDVEYVVKDGEVIIVDEFTGRLMPGRRWSEGLHQAVEAKEGLRIAEENQTLATITFQNFFRMYKKLGGMTGTAMTEAPEFWEIYKLDVVEIPTNNPMVRADHADVIYRTEKEKYDAIVKEIEALWKKGQPVLVGTRSIDRSEKLAAMLRRKGVPHQVLNAKYHEMEAQIISQAGKKGAVTIATNMAGRGTDIVLGGSNPEPEDSKTVKNLGGLFILGTERHEARRIDNQLRGRSGRQGDNGASRFYLSLDDELMRLFGSDRISGLMQRLGMQEGEEIQHPWISKSIESAQRKVEAMNFDIRKQLIDYDNVMNKQREAIYNLRNEILEGEDISQTIQDMLSEAVEEKVQLWTPPKLYPEQWDWASLEAWLLRTFNVRLSIPDEEKLKLTSESLHELLKEKVFESYKAREDALSTDIFRHVERMILLQMIDSVWKEHLYDLDQVKKGIGLRAYGQKDPKIEYQKESFALFEQMMRRIRETTVEYIFKVQLTPQPQRRVQRAEGNLENKTPSPDKIFEKTKPVETPALDNIKKIGRNDPCPCGSGQKYKKCCGK